MRGDNLAVRHDHDAIDIPLERDRLKCERAGHAVTIAVEGDGLILVNCDRGPEHASVKLMPGQRQRRSEILGKAILDHERAEERLHDALAFGLAAVAKERVQLSKIGDMRHRRGESFLHRFDGPLGVGLFVAARRHAEARFKDIMASECCVSRMNLAFASEEDKRSNGFWVVPPNLLGHRAEEVERCDHPLQDRLGSLEGKCEHERSVRVCPCGHQERHESAAVGKVDVNVSEIRFEALARKMAQRYERFFMPRTAFAHITLDLGIAAAVVVFVAEPPTNLSRSMTLLARGGLVVGQDLVNDRV